MSGLSNALGVVLAAWVCAAQTNSSDPTLGYREFKLDFAGGITLGILIAVVCLIVGLFYLLLGARYPKASVASCTFLFSMGGLFFLLNFFDIEAYICLIVGAGVGLVTIALTLKIWKLGLFVLGGAAGFVIWLVVKALAAESFDTAVTIYASLAAVVLVCALLAIKFEKQIFIAATSLIGSFFLVQGIDALIPDHASVFSLISDTSGLVCSYDSEWCTGIYIAIFVIAVIGMVIQFKVTAKFYKKRRGAKSKSDYRRKRRGKRAYAKEDDDAPRERRKYRNNEDKDGDRKEDRKGRERKHSDEAAPVASGSKGKLAEENAELRVRNSDLDRKLREAQATIEQAWDLTQEEKDLVTRFRVDKRENARTAKELAAREKARQREEQDLREAEEKERRRQEEDDARNAKKSKKAEKREKEREREREKEREREDAERQRQEEEDAYAAKKSRKKTKDEPPPYKAPEPEKKSAKKKKKQPEKKRRDSTSEEDSAEG